MQDADKTTLGTAGPQSTQLIPEQSPGELVTSLGLFSVATEASTAKLIGEARDESTLAKEQHTQSTINMKDPDLEEKFRAWLEAEKQALSEIMVVFFHIAYLNISVF